MRSLIGHKKDVYAVAFSPDSRLLASACADKSIKLWNVASGREIRTLSGHRNWVTTLAFSPDGRLLASGSWDKTVKIWEVETGREIETLAGHTRHIYTVAFDRDGQWLASGSEDGKIKLWKVRALGRQSAATRFWPVCSEDLCARAISITVPTGSTSDGRVISRRGREPLPSTCETLVPLGMPTAAGAQSDLRETLSHETRRSFQNDLSEFGRGSTGGYRTGLLVCDANTKPQRTPGDPARSA